MISFGWCSLNDKVNSQKMVNRNPNANNDPYFEYKKSLGLGLANLHIIG